MTSSDLLGNRLTEQWLGAGRTQEHLHDCATAGAQRLQLSASPPQKKFTRSCSSNISGIMENHNTHLAPAFTPNDLVPALVDVVVLPGPLGPFPFGGGMLSCTLPTHPPSPSSLHKQKQLLALCGFSPLVHRSAPRTCLVLWFRLCKLLRYSSNQFSRCAGWFSVNLVVFRGGETQKNLPCCSSILASPPPLPPFF